MADSDKRVFVVDKILKFGLTTLFIVTILSADIHICLSGLRAVGYVLHYQRSCGSQVSVDLLSALIKEVLSSLDTGLQDSLKEVVAKSLKILTNQPPPLYEEIDDSLVT